MEESVDKVCKFSDGGKLPCILVENKADLLYKGYDENISDLNDFASKNGFCGAFRASAKTGYNVDESMEYLINNIIERMEPKQPKKKKGFFSRLFKKII